MFICLFDDLMKLILVDEYLLFLFDDRPPVQRVSDRVMIPQDDHPDINFVGLLIGPR